MTSQSQNAVTPSALAHSQAHKNLTNHMQKICPRISMHCHPNMQTSVRTKNMQLPDKQIFQMIVRTPSGLDRSYLIRFCFLFGKKQARRMFLDTKDFNCEAAPNLKCSCAAENTKDAPSSISCVCILQRNAGFCPIRSCLQTYMSICETADATVSCLYTSCSLSVLKMKVST